LLTDLEAARRLLAALKNFVSSKPIVFTSLQSYLTIEASSIQGNDKFEIDIQRKTLNVKKCTYQTRHKKSIYLLRLDIEGPAYTTPDSN
jgi:hypothetical protein